jgi:hypothetical protein
MNVHLLHCNHIRLYKVFNMHDLVRISILTTMICLLQWNINEIYIIFCDNYYNIG